jgi:hypothetical protein
MHQGVRRLIADNLFRLGIVVLRLHQFTANLPDPHLTDGDGQTHSAMSIISDWPD